jgi:beta-barrel assembly-enhancing protease
MPIHCVTASVLAALILAAQPLAAAGPDLGNKMAEQVRGCTTAISNPIVQSLVDSLSRKLAAQLPKRDLAFTLNVIEEDLASAVHEPTALPGGYIFVPAALFVAAQDEAEFAGMLAQAMGQSDAIEEDLSRLGSRSYMMTDLLQAFVCTFPRRVPTGYLAEQRAIERRADLTAVSLMARAGFDPNALVRYVERVQAPPKPLAASWSPLPPSKKRVANMRAEIAKLPMSAYPATDSAALKQATEEVRRFLAAPSARSDAASLKRK